MLKDDSDYESYFEDTMRAGHYENNPESVEIMIRSSQTVVKELIRLGISFQRERRTEFYTRRRAFSKTHSLSRGHHRKRNHVQTIGESESASERADSGIRCDARSSQRG